MEEKLEIYDLDSKLLGIQNRKDFFYDIKNEYKKNLKVTKKVKVVWLLLMDSKGNIYSQKRSKSKKSNSNMYDKSVGGHVKAGDSYDLTLEKECSEELGLTIKIYNKDEFKKEIKRGDLKKYGIATKIENIDNLESIKKFKDSILVKPSMVNIYIGYYNGQFKFVDGECSDIRKRSINKLQDEIKMNPDNFTEDIKFLINRYDKFIIAI